MTDTWKNWGRNQQARPAYTVKPTTEDELGEAVGRGVAEGFKIKVIGSGHSFTDIACSDGLHVDVGAFDTIHDVDTERHRVTVGAGIVLRELNRRLWDLGLSIPSLGDIDAQTLAGATSTGTHGTGGAYQCISATIVGARIVTGDGSVLEVSDQHRPDLLAAVRVGLGAVGILTSVTLQCEPAFKLHAVESTLDIDELIEGFDAMVEANDHVEFFWFPHTRTGQLKVNNRTTSAVARRPKVAAFLDEQLLSNVGFGLMNRVGRRFPNSIPRLISAAMKPGDVIEYVAPGHEVFVSKRRVRFVEMEYAVPRAHVLEAFGRVRSLIDERAQPISFPIEVRVQRSDDIPLSMASGRDTGYIAVHMYRGTPYEEYFAAVEDIMADYAGRPHWGKLHNQNAETLAPLYADWDAFQKVLAELDPDGHFSNPYLDRVIRGPNFRSPLL